MKVNKASDHQIHPKGLFPLFWKGGVKILDTFLKFSELTAFALVSKLVLLVEMVGVICCPPIEK
jgi:hypothetical protein